MTTVLSEIQDLLMLESQSVDASTALLFDVDASALELAALYLTHHDIGLARNRRLSVLQELLPLGRYHIPNEGRLVVHGHNGALYVTGADQPVSLFGERERFYRWGRR